MKFAIIALVSAWAGVAVADTESAWFKLILRSDNKTLDGLPLYAGHQLPIEETLSAGDPSLQLTSYSVNFTFMASNTDGKLKPGFDPAADSPGYLNWYQRIGDDYYASALRAIPLVNYASNVALLEVSMGNTTNFPVQFDSNGLMYVVSNWADDTIVPPTYNQNKYYRWYYCLTKYNYTRYTLGWVFGDQPPQNPTCSKVDVVRQLV